VDDSVAVAFEVGAVGVRLFRELSAPAVRCSHRVISQFAGHTCISYRIYRAVDYAQDKIAYCKEYTQSASRTAIL